MNRELMLTMLTLLRVPRVSGDEPEYREGPFSSYIEFPA